MSSIIKLLSIVNGDVLFVYLIVKISHPKPMLRATLFCSLPPEKVCLQKVEKERLANAKNYIFI